jgi:glutathione S-transferase
MLTLYFAKGACSLASHIALEESGADYQAKRVDFSKNAQQTPE